MRACENLTDMLKFPLQDTLNIRNGITYSQLLEAILRIAYVKLEESDFANKEDGFKLVLEQIF